MTGTPVRPAAIRRVAAPTPEVLHGLADVLIDCVAGGASVGFMHPLSHQAALAFWTQVGEDAARGGRVLLVAQDAAGIAGTVQVVMAQPENQPHRADVAKMLVHRRARRSGLGAALMQAAEAAAREAGRTLLVLDTANDTAERLYRRLGWQRCGVIPDYALLPEGGLCATTILYRTLGPVDLRPLQTAGPAPI